MNRTLCMLAAIAIPLSASATDRRVCVEVSIRTHGEDQTAPPSTEAGQPPAEAPPSTAPPASAYPFPPRSYLQRLTEHYVTHEEGFTAAAKECEQTLTIELYPLDRGWTLFARYSGSEQEEKVDRVFFSEFPKVAQRVVLALLHNRRIEDTIDRLTVLKADSIEDIETIKGTNHFVSAIGSTFRFPVNGLSTAQGPDEATKKEFRLINPLDLQLGYRGCFRSWGIDAMARIGIGVGHKASRNNTLGGHVDLSADLGIALNLLWYLTPTGVNSFYVGTGGAFEMAWYEVVVPKDRGGFADDGKLFGAGLSVVGSLGYEFLRTSGIRPYVQAELNLPAYVMKTENDFGRINTWVPGVTVLAGVMF